MTESNGASYDTHIRRGPKPPVFKTHAKTVIKKGDKRQTLHLRKPKEIVYKMQIILTATATSLLLCEAQMAPWGKQLLCAALLSSDQVTHKGPDHGTASQSSILSPWKSQVMRVTWTCALALTWYTTKIKVKYSISETPSGRAIFYTIRFIL